MDGRRQASQGLKLLAALLVAAVLVAAPTSAGAQQDLHGGGGRAPLLVPNTQQVSDTLRALDRLHSYGYVINTPARAERAIRAWQKANRLTVDGQVGPQVLDSLNLTATASVPAVRVDPPVAASDPPVGDAEQVIRDVWPDELEDKAVAIATRESNLRPGVRNACCIGLFSIFFEAHRAWLGQYGVTTAGDLFDARVNATVALALYQTSGWHPWDCHGQCRDVP